MVLTKFLLKVKNANPRYHRSHVLKCSNIQIDMKLCHWWCVLAVLSLNKTYFSEKLLFREVSLHFKPEFFAHSGSAAFCASTASHGSVAAAELTQSSCAELFPKSKDKIPVLHCTG